MPRLPIDDMTGIGLEKAWMSLVVSAFPRNVPTINEVAPDPTGVPGVFSKSFLEYLDFFLNATRPAAYGKSFSALEEKAKKNRYYPGRLFVTNTISFVEERRFVCAFALEADEKLIEPQHGGNQSVSITHPWTALSAEHCFAHLTWGWTYQEGMPGNNVPCSLPILGNIAGKHRAETDKAIFVGTRINLNGVRFDSMPNGVLALAYRRLKVQFIEALPGQVRENLFYRPYSRGFSTLSDQAYLEEKFPDLAYLLGPLMPELLRCRLLVLDHVGTTLAFALAANVPTVCYWDPEVWPITQEAQAAFVRLKACGVLFENPQSAASHIGEIWHDVPGWWQSPTVASAVAQWRDAFANSSPHWRVGLLKTLYKLSAASNQVPNTGKPDV